MENSYQSSIGKYSINSKYYGTFGWSYRLKGLDKTNNNGMKRAIVMHSLACVKDNESTEENCLSLGCHMVSEVFFKIAAQYIDASNR